MLENHWILPVKSSAHSSEPNVSHFKLNRRQKLVLFLAWRTSEYDIVASLEALKDLHRRVQGGTSPMSRSAVLQGSSLGVGVLLLLATLSFWPNVSWLMLPAGICFAIGARVAWNRARDAVGAATSEQMSDPTFGHDPEDVLVLENAEGGRETVYQNRADSQYCHWNIDGPLAFESTYEYRVEGTKILERLLDEWSSDEGEKTHKVKDNVVLESEIRKHWMLQAKNSVLWKDDPEAVQRQADYTISARREDG